MLWEMPGTVERGNVELGKQDRVSPQEGEKFGRWMTVRGAQRCEHLSCP